MNKARREAITALHAQLDDIKGQVEMLQGEEQEYYDNMPENMQSGDKGTAAEEAASKLQEAVDQIEEAMSSLDDAGQQ